MKNAVDSGSTRSYWLIPLLSGLILLLFGIWFLVAPLESFKTLTIVFGIIIFLSGVIEMYVLIRGKDAITDHMSYVWGSVLNLVLGVLLIMNPETILTLISLLIGFWLIYKGGGLIKRAYDLRKSNSEKWKNNMFFGAILLVLAAILLWHPEIIGFTIAMWTSLAFIVIGALRIYFAFRIKAD